MNLFFIEKEDNILLLSILNAIKLKQPLLIYGEASTGKITLAKYVNNYFKNNNKFYLLTSNAKISKIESLINNEENLLCFSDFEQWNLYTIDFVCHNILKMKANIIITISESKIENLRKFFEKYNIVPEMFSIIYVPSLRERKEELLNLAKSVIEETAKKYKLKVKNFSSKAKNFIIGYPWYGNFHEFNNVIMKGFFYSKGDIITDQDLQRFVRLLPESKERSIQDFECYLREILKDFRYANFSDNQKLYSTILEEADKVFIDFAMKQTMNLKKACQYLGLSSNTFRKKYQKHYNVK